MGPDTSTVLRAAGRGLQRVFLRHDTHTGNDETRGQLVSDKGLPSTAAAWEDDAVALGILPPYRCGVRSCVSPKEQESCLHLSAVRQGARSRVEKSEHHF